MCPEQSIVIPTHQLSRRELNRLLTFLESYRLLPPRGLPQPLPYELIPSRGSASGDLPRDLPRRSKTASRSSATSSRGRSAAPTAVPTLPWQPEPDPLPYAALQ